MAATLAQADLPLDLRTLLDPGAMLDTVSELLVPSLQCASTREQLGVNVLRFKDRHCLLLYTLEDPTGGPPRRVIAKWFTKERRAKRLWTIVKAASDSAPLDRLTSTALRFDKDACTVFMGFIEGTLLKDILEAASDTPVAGIALACAETLARFHALPIDDGKPGTLDDELASLRKHVEEHGDPARETSDLIDQLERASQRLGAPPAATVVHTGFRPDSIIMDRNHATLIDLDGWAMGDPALDAGCFVAEVWRLAAEPGLSAIRPLADQFREHYIGLRPSDGLRERIDLYEAYTLIRLALRRMRNDARGKIRPKPVGTDALLERAAERLQAI